MVKDPETVGERVVESLVENSYGPREEIQGCTDDEIKELENEFGVSLPETYKSCLSQIGRNTNGFLRGSEFTYPYVKNLKPHAEEMIERQGVDFEFDKSDFVFMGHQGYSFFYFNAETGSDPPVFLFMSPDEPEKVADSFTDWIFDKIRN